jgi:hypothetical protein
MSDIQLSQSAANALLADLKLASKTASWPNPHIEALGEAITEANEAPSAEDEWRRLALQFDGHRMTALGYLRAVLKDPAAHSAGATEFLNGPPLSGAEVLAERIAALHATKPNGALTDLTR